jgi:hypothetical protein
VNALGLARADAPGEGGFVLGVALPLVLLVALWQGRRDGAAWRLLGAGVAVFLAALLPVLPLTAHFFDYFVGIAALGVALAVVGAAQLVAPRHWSPLVLALGLAAVGFDVATGQSAARTDPIFKLIDGGEDAAVSWMKAVSLATDAGVREAVVPSNAVTEQVFGIGHAERVFPGLPPLVIVVPAGQPLVRIPGRAVVPANRPGRRLQSDLPGWTARYAWLRAFVRWTGSPGRSDTHDPDAPFFKPMASSDSPQRGGRRSSRRSHGTNRPASRACTPGMPRRPSTREFRYQPSAPGRLM